MHIRELPQQLQEWLEVGQAVRINYGPGKPANETRYIRAWVDDGIIVYRVWRRQAWNYEVERAYAFWIAYDNGHLSPVKPKV